MPRREMMSKWASIRAYQIAMKSKMTKGKFHVHFYLYSRNSATTLWLIVTRQCSTMIQRLWLGKRKLPSLTLRIWTQFKMVSWAMTLLHTDQLGIYLEFHVMFKSSLSLKKRSHVVKPSHVLEKNQSKLKDHRKTSQ